MVYYVAWSQRSGSRVYQGGMGVDERGRVCPITRTGMSYLSKTHQRDRMLMESDEGKTIRRLETVICKE